jgi:hypothetical protein
VGFEAEAVPFDMDSEFVSTADVTNFRVDLLFLILKDNCEQK